MSDLPPTVKVKEVGPRDGLQAEAATLPTERPLSLLLLPLAALRAAPPEVGEECQGPKVDCGDGPHGLHRFRALPIPAAEDIVEDHPGAQESETQKDQGDRPRLWVRLQ